MNAETAVFISVGSNLGDKAANCRNGIEALAASGLCRLVRQSPFYRTEPVDYLDQDWFVNAVAKVVTDAAPETLLRQLLDIELQAGRVRGGARFGPRVIDLDLRFFGDRVIDSPDLVIPHPRMHKRRFVLMPMCDIDPLFRHPVMGRTVAQLLEALDETEQQVVPMPCAC